MLRLMPSFPWLWTSSASVTASLHHSVFPGQSCSWLEWVTSHPGLSWTERYSRNVQCEGQESPGPIRMSCSLQAGVVSPSCDNVWVVSPRSQKAHKHLLNDQLWLLEQILVWVIKRSAWMTSKVCSHSSLLGDKKKKNQQLELRNYSAVSI